MLRPTALLVCLLLPFAAAAQDFRFSALPTEYRAGSPLAVQVDYTKPATDEQRLVFLVELRAVEGDALVARQVFDAAGQGYRDRKLTLSASIAVPAGTAGPLYVRAVATPWSLNRALVEQMRTYPTDGTFTYLWQGGGYGVTQNIFYLGSLISPKPSGNTTYCSGLAFDQFVTTWNNYNSAWGHARIGTMSASNMETFRRVWYGVTDAEKLACRAVPEWNLGVEITDFEEAQEGDACQFWRWSGSGHNPVFVSWIRNGSGTITGVRYWGSQGSSNGIGYHQENFGTTSGINRARFYLARTRKPRDGADYTWAISAAETKATPLLPAGAPAEGWQIF